MEKAAGLSALKGEKLKDTPQWRTWFARIKLYAKQKKVWDLCNPDTDVDDLPEPLEEPDEPEYPDGGDSNEKKEWRDLIDVYKIRYSKWEKQTKGLDDVNEYIVTYLDPIHHISLLEYETPYERLVYLRDRFARSTAYEEEIRMKWRAFAAQKPSRGTDIDGWLTTWNTLREHAVSFKLDDAKSANRDFLQAVKDVLPIWWQGKYQEIIMDKTPYETRDLVESFRAMYREIGPKNSVSVSTAPFGAFSTWQGYQEAKPEANTEAKLDKKKDNEPKPYDQRVCPCGRRGHRAAECYTLNESARPTGWRVNEKLLEKANKALAADPGWKKWVDDAIKDANAAQSTANAMLGSFSRFVDQPYRLCLIGHAKQWVPVLV